MEEPLQGLRETQEKPLSHGPSGLCTGRSLGLGCHHPWIFSRKPDTLSWKHLLLPAPPLPHDILEV